MVPITPLLMTDTDPQKQSDFVNSAQTSDRPPVERHPGVHPAVGAIGKACLALVIVFVLGQAIVSNIDLQALKPTAFFSSSREAPGQGLVHRDVKPRREVRGSTELLVIEGKVLNITKEAIAVPPMKVSLNDAQDQEVATQVINLDKRILPPNESLRFKAEFANPPGNSRRLSLNFLPLEKDGHAPAGSGDTE